MKYLAGSRVNAAAETGAGNRLPGISFLVFGEICLGFLVFPLLVFREILKVRGKKGRMLFENSLFKHGVFLDADVCCHLRFDSLAPFASLQVRVFDHLYFSSGSG